MRRKMPLDQEINAFLDDWDCRNLCSFIKDVIPLIELYCVDEGDDWVQKNLDSDSEETNTVRLVRTAYLLSWIAERHAGSICMIRSKYPDLWKRIEKEACNFLSPCNDVC